MINRLRPCCRAALIEIVVRIAHVGIFRFVTDFRREFRVAGVNVRNVGRQQRLIAVVPNWKRKSQDLDETGHMTRGCAARSLPNTIASPGRVTFGLVDLVNGCEELSRSDDEIANAATEFPRWTVIVPGRVLDISETNSGHTKYQWKNN